MLACCLALTALATAQNPSNIIDEVVWVVGDDAIFLSDIENMRLQMQVFHQEINGDPYCAIPEMMAIQKLFIHQAKIDSLDVSDSQVFQYVENRINALIKDAGSQEKLEEWVGKSLSRYREDLRIQTRDQSLANEMQTKLIKNVKATPSEVRTFYKRIPQDSLPYIPTTVEVEILTFEPIIPIEEIDDIKRRLREFTEQVTKGEKQFSALARLYSADRESAPRGGETGFRGKAEFDSDFAAVAFELNDPKRVSRIVETEYGYHIIQLVEKRGDRINVRHILLRPYVSEEDLDAASLRLDSLRNYINEGRYTFEEAAFNFSSDKRTRNNNGLMVNSPENPYASERSGTSRFELEELPPEIAKAIDTLQVNGISRPFVMLNEKGKEIVALAKLKTRTAGHKASLTDDFQELKSMVESMKREQIINEWIDKKIKETYIRINDKWKNCEFEHNGWVQQ